MRLLHLHLSSRNNQGSKYDRNRGKKTIGVARAAAQLQGR